MMTAPYKFWRKNTKVRMTDIAALLTVGLAQVLALHLLIHHAFYTQMAVIAKGGLLIFLPFLASFLASRMADHATAWLRTTMLRSLALTRTNEIEQLHVHTFSKAATQDVDHLFQFWKEGFGNICFNLPILLYMAVLLLLHIPISLVAGACFVLVALFVILFKINRRTRIRQREHYTQHLHLQNQIRNYTDNIFQFRLYRNEALYLKILEQHLASFSRLTAQLSQYRQLYTTLVSAILLLFFGGGLWLMRNHQTIKPTDAAMATIVFIEIRRIVTEIFSIIHSYQKAQETALQIEPWLRHEPHIASPAMEVPHFTILCTQGLKFRYRPGQPLIIYPDLEMKAGESIWLKGPNGQGKSTFWKIISGLYQGEQTAVWLDAAVFQGNGITPFCRNIAAVTEPARSYNGKLWEIIGSFSARREEVIAWLAKHDLISQFEHYPQQLETCYNSAARNLSAGQLKWLLIMQAFFKKPEILILDEPFSSLDMIRQQLTLRLIKELSPQTTLIIISHQDIPVDFDRIIMLNTTRQD